MCAVYDLNADLSICRKHSLKDFLCCTILKLLFLTNNIVIIVSKDQLCLLYLINRYIEYFPCILRSHLNSWIANCVV
jgi:hypothetical protein